MELIVDSDRIGIRTPLNKTFGDITGRIYYWIYERIILSWRKNIVFNKLRKILIKDGAYESSLYYCKVTLPLSHLFTLCAYFSTDVW